jgi:predicted nicotinamide N-methyase
VTAPPSGPAWLDELVTETVPLPDGDLELLQPRESAELPDEREVEWAPMVPYWSVLWRSGLTLARELSNRPLDGLRVVELGCGMGVPSLVASRAGASVLATDAWPEALELLAENAGRNGLEIETAEVDWATPDKLVARGPFDLVLAADVLYERQSVAKLLRLLPRLAPQAIVADPGRPAADAFLAEARRRWRVETHTHGAVRIHALAFD